MDRADPGWLVGEQTVFDELTATTTWHAGRRPMYDRMVDVPRLTATLPEAGPGPPGPRRDRRRVSPPATASRATASAWPGTATAATRSRPHGDQVARTMQTTTMAIVSCGAPRRFHLSPVGRRARHVQFDLGHGDLLVMGGTIQRTWRHGVPKTNRSVGPRLCDHVPAPVALG